MDGFNHTRIPIGHQGGDQDEIRLGNGAKILYKPFRIDAIATEGAFDGSQSGRLGDGLFAVWPPPMAGVFGDRIGSRVKSVQAV